MWTIEYKWNSIEERDVFSMEIPEFFSPIKWVKYGKDFDSVESLKNWVINYLTPEQIKILKKGRSWQLTNEDYSIEINLESF